jgi:hypothetical protein
LGTLVGVTASTSGTKDVRILAAVRVADARSSGNALLRAGTIAAILLGQRSVRNESGNKEVGGEGYMG